MLLRTSVGLLFLFVVLTIATGCGSSGPQVVPVSGTLTRNGKPVANMEVYFIPTQGRNSVASTDEQGRFTLGYTADQEGAQVGNHTVYVVYNPPDPSFPPPPDLAAIMAKYGEKEKSPLKIEVKEPEDNLELRID